MPHLSPETSGNDVPLAGNHSVWPAFRDSQFPKSIPKTLYSHWWVFKARPALLLPQGLRAPRKPGPSPPPLLPPHCPPLGASPTFRFQPMSRPQGRLSRLVPPGDPWWYHPDPGQTPLPLSWGSLRQEDKEHDFHINAAYVVYKYWNDQKKIYTQMPFKRWTTLYTFCF